MDVHAFHPALAEWFKQHARVLPWRGTHEPYHIWVSEIMLQQTRVAAVIAHYNAFLQRFPTLVALALAPEQEVLAAWSGLGYYRRARMLHKAAQFVMEELGGALPRTAQALRQLPGVGDYTAAAIASIAFGEQAAVLDGNVERVLLRVLGQPETAGKTARAELVRHATALLEAGGTHSSAGDHNQAMMELGAVVCLPRNPLCLRCPVLEQCRTRGEHSALKQPKMRSQEMAYMLATRKKRAVTEVLLVQRPPDASLMPGMWELPTLEANSLPDEPALLRIRHAITNTNYYVGVYPARAEMLVLVPAKQQVWKRVSLLNGMALTGLARKILHRLELIQLEMPRPRTPKQNGRIGVELF